MPKIGGTVDKEESEGSGKPRRTSISTRTVLLFLAGIGVPIVAALIPAAIDYFKTYTDFRYTVRGPITVKNRSAMSIVVKNAGRVVEKNVEIWLPRSSKHTEFTVEVGGGFLGTRAPYELRVEDEHAVISIGDLRPTQQFSAAIMMSKPDGIVEPLMLDGGKFNPFLLLGVRVMSRERIAELDSELFTPRPKLMDYVYQVGFWGFLIVILVALTGVAIVSAESKKHQRKIQDQLEEVADATLKKVDEQKSRNDSS